MIVRIVGDNAEFDASIDKSQSKFEKFSKSAERIGRNLTKFVTLPILGAAAAAVKFAVDAEETGAKFRTAFRGIQKEAESATKDLVKNFGLSITQSERLLSGTGDLLKGFGATERQALDLSSRVQKLSVDLASYNNIQGGAERASQILTRAMLGEREALTSLGVKVSEVDVQQRLAAEGLEDLEGKALLLAKAQAVLELVTGQSGDAIGDFARTSDSAANQMRVVSARARDVAVQFGQVLLPTFVDILGKVGSFVEKLSELDEKQKKTIVTVGLVAAAIGPLILAVKSLTTAIAFLAKNPLVLALTAAAALTVGVYALISAQERAKETTKGLGDELNEFATGPSLLAEDYVNRLNRALIVTRIEQLKLEYAAAQAGRIIWDEGQNIGTLTDALKEAEQALLDFDEAQKRGAGSGAGGTGGDSGGGGGQLTKTQKALKAIADEFVNIGNRQQFAALRGEEYNVVAARRAVVIDEINKLLDDQYRIEGPGITQILSLYGAYVKKIDLAALSIAKWGKITDDQVGVNFERLDELIENWDRVRDANQAAADLATELHEQAMDQIEAERVARLQAALQWTNAVGDIFSVFYERKAAMAEEGSEEEKAYLLKQAKAEKAFAIFSIAINTAIAVVKALPNVIKAITIGALGAASAIAVAAKPLPQFAQGGIVTPTPGGTDVNVAEAGQTEVIFPLDKLGEFLGDMPGLGGAEEGSIHLTVQMDSKPILEKIFPATRNREVIIDARAVI